MRHISDLVSRAMGLSRCAKKSFHRYMAVAPVRACRRTPHRCDPPGTSGGFWGPPGAAAIFESWRFFIIVILELEESLRWIYPRSNSSNGGCARLGGEVALPLGVDKGEMAVLVVLIRQHCCTAGAAVRRAVGDEVPGAVEEEAGQPRCAVCPLSRRFYLLTSG